MTERRCSRQEEFRLSCVVADYLRRALPSTAVWSHFPAGEARSAITGARLKRMGTARGWPDYLIVYDGKLIGLELKTPKGPVSKEQQAVGEAFSANGMAWTVARSLDAVESFLRSEGVPLKATVHA